MAYDLENCMVLQPTTQDIKVVGKNTTVYTETWKGPWDEIKKVTKENTIFNQVIVVGLRRPKFNPEKWKQEYEAPKPFDETTYPWVIMSYSITEGVGNSGFLVINYEAGLPEYEGGDEEGTTPEKRESIELTEARQWTLNWHASTTPILNFSQIPDKQVLFREYPATEEWTYYQHSGDSEITAFPEDSKERQIASLYAKSINPQFHFPVITHHSEWNDADNAIMDGIGDSLDRIEVLPQDCPYKKALEDKGWKFIKSADFGTIKWEKSTKWEKNEEGEVIQTEDFVPHYVREIQWTGARFWDERFYSKDNNKRWEPIYPEEAKAEGNAGNGENKQ